MISKMVTPVPRELIPMSAALACAVQDQNHCEVFRLMAKLAPPELRALCVVLAAQVNLDGKVLTQEDLQAVIGRWGASRSEQLFAGIVSEVAAVMDVDEQEIRGKAINKRVVAARAVVCWVTRQYAFSYPQIGQMVGRDHSTVIPLVKKVVNSPHLKSIAMQVQANLESQRQAAA